MSGKMIQKPGPLKGRALVTSLYQSFAQEYEKTPYRLKALDAFAACALVTALIQFLYMLLVGSFPFNAFLAGFFCCIGTFVLTLSLRLQLDPQEDIATKTTPEKAFGNYTLAMLVLFLSVWNYIG